jgi:hypothetical protein
LACQTTTRGGDDVRLGNSDWRTRLTAWPRGSNTALRTAVVSDKPSTTKMLGEFPTTMPAFPVGDRIQNGATHHDPS